MRNFAYYGRITTVKKRGFGMAKTYMEEYTGFINGIQNRLLKIQFRFNGILADIKEAVDSGIITEELRIGINVCLKCGFQTAVK